MSLAGEEGGPFVVGIGASAGGLEALERFFDHVPEDTGMAFVVVQHLSPDFRSLMDELLARHTELPIHLVENGMPIEANHVYLIPAKKEMIVSGRRLLLSERDRQQELTLPIDVFFRSLAQDCGERAVAIVLSGSGSDGSRGARDVHDAGGLVIVQDVDSAQFDGMPRMARDTGVAHHVVTPEAMPAILVAHANRTPGPRPGRRDEPAGPAGFDTVFRLLQSEFGLDFQHYKPSTVTRRIERRLQLSRAQSLDDYVARLDRDRSELDVLYRDLLIGVTRFFRNEEAFALMEEKVLPELMRRGHADEPLRAWVAGCATGEEAYSLAIVLHELAARHGERPIKIFASDVHRGSIETATRATYDEEALRNVSPARLERYFIRRGETFQVVPELRQMIVFAPHNVIRDAPFTRVDLISCRNLLIYLQPTIQQKVLSLFRFALKRGGVLMLGPSESPGAFLDDFEPIDRHWRIYRKQSDARMSVDPRLAPHRAVSEPRVATPPTLPFARHSLSQLLATYDALLDEHMPPGLLVTERGELVHAFAGASRYLEHRDGRQGLDIADLVQADLKMILVGGLRRATKEPNGIVFRGVRIETDAGAERVSVTLRAVPGKGGASPHVMILFSREDGTAPPPPASEREIDLGDVSREQIAALGAELAHTKENLQAAIEELETSNEELQATNEELLASNEELQSTNEELQSVNEELYTVNAEYQRKIAELVELTNDMDNLLASTDIGMIFLDRQLRVRKFTQQIGVTFNLIQQDVGRSLETFTHNIRHPELMRDLRRVIETGERLELEIEDRQGRAFFMRILPYRAKGAVEGVVLTLIDVSGLKAAEDALFHERYLLNSLLSGVPDGIYFKDQGGRFIRVNDAMARRLGTDDPRAVVGRTSPELRRDEEGERADLEVLRSGAAQHYRLEQSEGLDGEAEWLLATRLPLRDQTAAVVGMVGILRDVSEQKRAEQEALEAVRRRDQFLAMLSHELRNPLNAIVASSALLQTIEVDGDRRQHVLSILERQAGQMARLLDDLLEASRVTQSKIELRRSVVDLRNTTRDAADAVRSLMDARGVSFVVDVAPEPLFADVDPVRLQQIQVNLLNNAAKYTPRGGQVTLQTKRVDDDAIIRVEDTGVGIPQEMLDTVFELFVQARRTLDRSDGGLGLGLSLVRSLVTMHGGSVTAHSDGEGLGSHFVVRLPLVEPPAAKQRGRTKPRRTLPHDASVVVVEDNPDNRDMLCELLRYAGFVCRTAEDGNEGLEVVREIRPDVVIIDVGLPGIDGFELARRLRREPAGRDALLIALTGYGQLADRRRALEAGFDEHLVKPLQPDLLMWILRGEGMAQA